MNNKQSGNNKKNYSSKKLTEQDISARHNSNNHNSNNNSDLNEQKHTQLLSAFRQILRVKLTRRELDCCVWLMLGYSSQQIADKLAISARTVEHYIINLKLKFVCAHKSSLGDYLRKQFHITAIEVIEQLILAHRKQLAKE